MQVIPGSANEAITGVLPLYINSSHWTVAREKLKAILGWTCTLNILGFSYSQVSAHSDVACPASGAQAALPLPGACSRLT